MMGVFPERSDAGRAALDIFYVGFNDVNFYVEDADQENLYYAILSKWFPDASITRIFPLGGKQNVIRHASDSVNEAIQRRVYIVDPDFDRVSDQLLDKPGLFYLDRFCIESYLCDDEDAFVELIIESHPKLKRKEVRESLEFAIHFERAVSKLRPLFGLFFIAQYCSLGIKNCDSPVELFCVPNILWEPDQEKVEQYRRSLNSAAVANGASLVSSDVLSDPRLINFVGFDGIEVVSGKFILAMLFHLVKKRFRMGSSTFASMAYRLAKNSSLASFAPVASRIEKFIQV